MSDNPITVCASSPIPRAVTAPKNTRLLVDGQDIAPHCRAVTMLSRVGGVNEVVVELLPRHGMAFDLPVAVVTLEMSPLTGYRIVSETRGDRVHYWTEPEEPRVMIIPEPTPSASADAAARTGERGDERMGLFTRRTSYRARRDRSATPMRLTVWLHDRVHRAREFGPAERLDARVHAARA